LCDEFDIIPKFEGTQNLLQAPEDPGSDTLKVPVLKVFDGDGFLTRSFVPQRQREVEFAVRFGFIDAPELGQYGGPEARDFLAELIEGRWVDLVVLTKMDTGNVVDRHGRLVAIPYLMCSERAPVQGRRMSRNIELEMLLNGWAWLLERYCPSEPYYLALDDAQRHRRGIWAREDNLEPWEFKRRKYASMKKSRKGPPRQASLFNLDTP
jgi:endonuclease YncB( thermonuclease family)